MLFLNLADIFTIFFPICLEAPRVWWKIKCFLFEKNSQRCSISLFACKSRSFAYTSTAATTTTASARSQSASAASHSANSKRRLLAAGRVNYACSHSLRAYLASLSSHQIIARLIRKRRPGMELNRDAQVERNSIKFLPFARLIILQLNVEMLRRSSQNEKLMRRLGISRASESDTFVCWHQGQSFLLLEWLLL